MSNTSSLSSYDSSTAAPSTGPGVAVAVGIGAAALVAWLCEDAAADRTAFERHSNERREDRLAGLQTEAAHPSAAVASRPLTTVPLKLTREESLVRSAERLGYNVEPLAGGSASSKPQSVTLLRHASGERLAITRSTLGRLQVHTLGERGHVERLVRQHTLDQATAHLQGQGMHLEVAGLATGELQILAREQKGGNARNAVLRVQVRKDGDIDVDVDCVLGKRCDKIVGDLATAIGAEVKASVKKAARYEEPGEPTTIRV